MDAGKKITVGFEQFENGRALVGDELATLFTLESQGPNAGLAIFDSTPSGPNAHGQDPDLLVGRGNLLILQNDCCTFQTVPGVYDRPNDDDNGGLVVFGFTVPSQLVSIDLVDIDLFGGSLFVTLTDVAGRARTYFVPAGFTTDIAEQGPPGFMRLDLETLAPQPGSSATATAFEQASFDPTTVVKMEVAYSGSVGLDCLVFRVLGAPACFYPQASYPILEPYDVATADLDGNGTPDMIVPDSGRNAVLVHLNPGDGRLLPAVAYPTAFRPRGVAVADLNGDGHLDLAVVNVFLTGAADFNGAVSILLNEGQGTFGPQTEYVLPESTDSIVCGDYDHDGDVDVAVGPASQLGGRDLYVFFNRGDGTLAPPLEIPTEISPNSLALQSADLNGDDVPDLMLPDSSSTNLSLWFSRADGTFGPKSLVPAGDRPDATTVADMNGDGKADLVVLADRVLVLEGLGDGTFGSPVGYGSFALGGAILAVDLDADGDLDVVAGSLSGVTLLENVGDAVLASWAAYPTVATNVGALGAEDLDGDGAVDLLVADIAAVAGGVSVLRSLGDETFSVHNRYSVGEGPNGVILADFDADGRLDAASANRGEDSVAVLLGDGNGTLGPAMFYPTACVPEVLVASDLDGDGSVDLAVTCVGDDVVSVLLNNGAGTFAPRVDYPVPDGPMSMTAGDWTGDGHLDLAVGCFVRGDTVALPENQGNGGFVPLGLLDGADPTSVVHGDWDGDGDLDLAVTRIGLFDRVAIWTNDGAGGYTEAHSVPVVNNPNALHATDWNGDGVLDLAFASGGDDLFSGDDDSITLLLNPGGGQFGLATSYASGWSPISLSSADVDGDGDLELLAANANRASVSVFPNRGNGTLGARSDYRVDPGPRGVFSGDMNGDGLPDLVVSSTFASGLSVLLGECE